jgi:hypothetical protein
MRGIALSFYRVEHSEEIPSAVAAAKTDGAAALNVLAYPMLHANRHDISWKRQHCAFQPSTNGRRPR